MPGRVWCKAPLDTGSLERGVVDGFAVVVYTDRLAVTVDESCPLALIPVLQIRFDLRMHRHYAIPTGIRLNPACNDPPVDVNVEPCELHHFSDSHTCIDENHDGTSPHVAASRQLFNLADLQVRERLLLGFARLRQLDGPGIIGFDNIVVHG